MHLVSIDFDDGFRQSAIKAAKIFESFGLRTTINVIAKAEDPGFQPPDEYHEFEYGDFELWKDLHSRGHSIMPHGLLHLNNADLPFETAKQHILECLQIFEHKLPGFKAGEAVFNFPFNCGTEALTDWLKDHVRACRVGGDGVNPVPHIGQFVLHGSLFGPGSCENDLNREIERLLAATSGWLVYCAHGLDGEGWGPMRSDYLKRLLDRLLVIQSVSIMPTATAFQFFDQKNGKYARHEANYIN